MLFIWHQVSLMSTFRFSLLFKIYVLGSNPEIEKLVNPEEVTNAAIETAGQIYAYIKKKFAREGLSNAYPQLMICSEPATSWKTMKDIYTDVADQVGMESTSSFSTKTIDEICDVTCSIEELRVTLKNYNGIQISQANNKGSETYVIAATREEKFPLSSEVRRDDPGSETYCIRVPPDINSRILRLLLP
ncbi:BnaC03g22560D [Brassica napus]|uniref:BnaC03g22560D protein n=2 Tax=Brassica TaxID=3705 RepID=A0A078GHR6_BRANA|nr:BnaC03g22560D [Brassica napus]VDD03730.1 unnamed protein product [Brassica rapa]